VKPATQVFEALGQRHTILKYSQQPYGDPAEQDTNGAAKGLLLVGLGSLEAHRKEPRQAVPDLPLIGV
jgi:hypothetical protein